MSEQIGGLDFYKIKTDKYETNIEKCFILYTQWTKFLYDFGFRRFDVEKKYIFIFVKEFIIEIVEVHHVQDYFMEYLENCNEDIFKTENEKEELIETFYRAPSHYFNEKRLTLLNPKEMIKFNLDTKKQSYIYYKNGFVIVSENEYKLKPYSELNNHVWKSQILDREFQNLNFPEAGDNAENSGVFASFISKICSDDITRVRSLMSLLGYLMHDYFETKLKAIVFTDSSISLVPNGRTGKSLVGKALSKMRSYMEIGKEFDPGDRFKYQNANIDTQIMHLNDLNKTMDIEDLFTDISEGVPVQKKGQTSFTKSMKILLSMNKTLKVDGNSAKDRIVEFEFSDYFSPSHTPEKEFGMWFFADWLVDEWAKFDNFMICCIQIFLKHGLIEVEPVNLLKRKLLDRTNPDFVEWVDRMWKNEDIKLNIRYDKNDLHESFLADNEDFRNHRYLRQQRTLTAFLKRFAEFTREISEVKEQKSNGKAFITFLQ